MKKMKKNIKDPLVFISVSQTKRSKLAVRRIDIDKSTFRKNILPFSAISLSKQKQRIFHEAIKVK